MSQKRQEQTVPMTAHLHMVIRLHELAWFHYDWKVHRKTCAVDYAEWGICKTWQLLCTSEGRFMKGSFDPLLKGTSLGKEEGFSSMTPARPKQPPLQQRSGGSSARK